VNVAGPSPTVATLVEGAKHAASLDGAPRLGAAAAEGRYVRLAVWTDRAGRVIRASFQATTCAALIAYAERACQLLEAGLAPEALAPETLRQSVRGVHPAQLGRAELVASAVARLSTPTDHGAAT
jgi:NifU-like protein involved in Fe-S cluster formation